MDRELIRLCIHLGVQVALLTDDAGSKRTPWTGAQKGPAHMAHHTASGGDGESFCSGALKYISSLQEQVEDFSQWR